MKIKQIHIDKYKIFQNFNIDFCTDDIPLKIIVLTGINGTGKSTLLEFITFHQFQADQKIRYGSLTVIDDSKEKNFDIPPKASTFEDYLKLFKNEVIYLGLKTADQATKNLSDVILEYVDNLIYEKNYRPNDAYQKINDSIQSIFGNFKFHIKFKGISGKKQLIFVTEKNEEFPVDSLSDGEKQILTKILPLFLSDIKNKIILMDEPESSLHPSWQSYLLPVLRQCADLNNCQFILASHSPQIISSAHTEEIRILKRDENGNIQASTCTEGPYGWTVEKVLNEIQKVGVQRVPEIEEKIASLHKDLADNNFESDEFNRKLAELEQILGESDADLMLIRMERIRKNKIRNSKK
ncbi:AAA family ATPase [uncultured Succinatimonas sp.]|uniref:AAA family ATPase n=1 Tax=uncultured Succinatimonas sp. TaxID=1262973 RepID=UPI0025E7296C|nr:AAA family ATPase [uncultured Succinatimonas sp.]